MYVTIYILLLKNLIERLKCVNEIVKIKSVKEDILIFEAGTKVGADMRVFETNNLTEDESLVFSPSYLSLGQISLLALIFTIV